MAEIEKEFKNSIPLLELFQNGTIEGLTRLIGSPLKSASDGVIPINTDGEKMPIYIIASGIGMKHLGSTLGSDHPVCLVFPYRNGKPAYQDSIQETASVYYQCLTRFQPEGPYCLIGHSADGHFALELARLIQKNGRQVAFLGLIDSCPPLLKTKVDRINQLRFYFANLKTKETNEVFLKLWRSLKWRLSRVWYMASSALMLRKWENQGRVRQVKHYLVRRYSAEPYQGDVTFFSASYNAIEVRQDLIDEWKSVVKGEFKVIPVKGDHTSVIHPPQVSELGRKIMEEIGKIDQPE